MTPSQVNVAAEAFTALVMSHAGYDVAMQYGTTQPDWDIMATKGPRTLKLQVKGSQDGAWGLFQRYLKDANYHGALCAWEATQLPDLVFVLVQFKNVEVGASPRCYVARPSEILAHMKTTRRGHGETTLHENHLYRSGVGADHTDTIPASWLFSQLRIDTL